MRRVRAAPPQNVEYLLREVQGRIGAYFRSAFIKGIDTILHCSVMTTVSGLAL